MKTYSNPELEVVRLKKNDIVTLSVDPNEQVGYQFAPERYGRFDIWYEGR
jgi:hypothetical protein